MTDYSTEGGERPSRITIGDGMRFQPEPMAAELQADAMKRKQLRAEELAHLARLRARVLEGMDAGVIDVVSGTEILLNISKVRTTLAGIGMYPF